MKKRIIKKVAVLGSGIMGSRIAIHFANIGVEVLLLDIAPKELLPAEEAKGLTLDSPVVKQRIVNTALTTSLKSKPAPGYKKGVEKKITTGTFDDDMSQIATCDWIIEVVVERLDIKKIIFEQVEKYRKAGTLITSNTSGIPIQMMAEGRSDDFKQNFCGSHFFNPPRYLRLLEIIPGPDTKQEVIDFLMHYGDLFLGKETVLCKDTPAFIANRVGVYAIVSALHKVEEMGLSVSEVDKLTGTIIGRQKSATFRTIDVVGLDTLVNVANNLKVGLPNDESIAVFDLPKSMTTLHENNWLGDKTGQGYFKKTKDENGKKTILELNLQTFEYQERQKVKFEVFDQVKDIEDVKKRLPVLLADKTKVGDFYRVTFFDLFRYCSFRIPEIADELYRIDQAVAAGFGWELGPFATWDAVGLKNSVAQMEEAGQKPAQWVYDMLASGAESFYKMEAGVKKYYDIETKAYKVVSGTEGFVLLDTLRGNNIVWENAGATLFDLGDEVLGLEFHTKMNSLGAEVIEGINTAITKAEEGYKGLVIGNEGINFSAGANLAMLFMFACDQEYDEIDMMIRQFQHTMLRARYSSVPVVAAPAGMALGGGCELSLHCDAIQAHAETYMGLVEVGVGLIPGGGGTKEMTLRVSDSYEKGDPEFNRLQETFMAIATAKVATSAHEAQDIGFLKSSDLITLNRNRLLGDAKQRVLELYDAGYTQPVKRKDIKVQGKAGLALIEAGVEGMLYGKYISEHDKKIAQKLSWVMNGGDLSQPTLVSEDYLLDLEREAFLSLTGEKKTLERIQSILFKGRPLRN